MLREEYESLLQPGGEVGMDAKRFARKFKRRMPWLLHQAAMDEEDLEQELLLAVVTAVPTFAESHPKNSAELPKDQFRAYAYKAMWRNQSKFVRHHRAEKRRPEKGLYSVDALKSSTTKSRTGRRSSPKTFTVASQRDGQGTRSGRKRRRLGNDPATDADGSTPSHARPPR
jgi:hypothetical protein